MQGRDAVSGFEAGDGTASKRHLRMLLAHLELALAYAIQHCHLP